MWTADISPPHKAFERCSRRVVAMLMATILGGCAPLATPIDGAPRAPSAQISKLMEEALVPGLQMAVIDRGKIEVLPFGVADVQSRAPVTSETVFEAASLGKPVFAYGVLRLANEGRIDLDKPVGHYLEDLPPVLANLTARQLLSHSAGLLPNAPPTGGTLSTEPQSTPRFSYSGEGYALLQRAVERITGQPVEDYMRRSVFEPLGMTSSSYVWRDDYANRKAFGHGYTGGSAGRTRIREAKVASSLETTAGDYARFLVAAVEGAGLRPNVARDFLRPQVALEEGCVICLGKPRSATYARGHWALGLGVERTGARDFVWHWGDNQTMQSYAAIDTSAARGIVILTNSANGHSIAREIATSMLGVDAPGYAWVGSYAPHTEPVRRLLSKIVRSGIPSLDPADVALPRQDALRVAERLVSGGRPDEAAELLRTIMVRGEATAAEFGLLAEAERKAGNLPAARSAAATALRLEPGSSRAQQVLARIEQSERIVPAERLERYAGTYSSPFGELDIRTDGRRLTATLVDQPPSDMLPLGDRTFLMEAMGVPIEFVEGESGAVTHAIVRAGGEIKLPRLREK